MLYHFNFFNIYNNNIVVEYILLGILIFISAFYGSLIFMIILFCITCTLLYFFYLKQHFVDPVRMFDEVIYIMNDTLLCNYDHILLLAISRKK